MQKLIFLTLSVIIYPLYSMHYREPHYNNSSLTKTTGCSIELQHKEMIIKERFFRTFIERYNYNYDTEPSPHIPMVNYSKLRSDFLNNTLNPYTPVSSSLLKEYAETMSEWNSNLEK